ncbi:MAG TPA: potassium channel protein [Roseiflexaceae bacterium]|nr:potassium channel protein [Roseiflexaceae bacterium]
MTFTPPPSSRRMQIGCGVLAAVLIVGTAGFMAVENWSPVEALYTTVLIVSTLGFSDLRPSDTAGQVLTIGLIAGGVGTLYYLVGALAQTVIEDQLDWGRRRSMEQQIAHLTGHYIVCGYGRVGQELCRQLAQQGCDFVVVDNAPERVERVRTAGMLVVEGDASDDAVLRKAGVARARALLTAVKSDAGNVYITLSARALNPQLFIVARAATPEAEHKLTIAGANRVISPYVLGGRSMAGMALRPAVMDFLELLVHSDDLEMWLEEVSVEAGSSLDGVAVGEARLREEVGITVLAVRHADGRMAINPGPDMVLAAGDKLIALGTRGGLERTEHVAQTNHKDTKAQRHKD